jgi:hypothetical protein
MNDEAMSTMIEVERQRTQADVAAGKGAPLPFTPYTPQEVMNGADGNPAEQTSGNSTTQNTSPQNTVPLPGRARFRPF